jgi:UDP-2-acetamido-3-amino-2,3-dideoxy-glucuronate N-acetyltransferase
MNYQIDPSSIVDNGAFIGEGTKIWHFSHICAGAKIGNNCSLGQNVFVANDVIIGNNVKIQNNVSVYDSVILEDDVFCGPSMVFTNVYNPRAFIIRKNEYRKTIVKKGASIGANATILCGVTIGNYAFIAAGSVVKQDVKDYALMAGVPAIHKAWVCICGYRISGSIVDGTYSCNACKKLYEVINCNCTLIK